MSITPTDLRADIYRLLDRVLETGEPLTVRRKGRLLHIVPEEPAGKLERLVRRDHVIKGDPEELVHMDWPGDQGPIHPE